MHTTHTTAALRRGLALLMLGCAVAAAVIAIVFHGLPQGQLGVGERRRRTIQRRPQTVLASGDAPAPLLPPGHAKAA